ncbi:MAG: PhoH family protein [Thermodesulfobacteriota bacterium]|nr:PhoH family protein [Thermodesulfobacteriota bacterium]
MYTQVKEKNLVVNKQKEVIVKKIFDNLELASLLIGEKDRNIKRIENLLGVKIRVKSNQFTISGGFEDVQLTEKILDEIYSLLAESYPVYYQDIDYAIRILSADKSIKLKDIFMNTVYLSAKKRAITPKSLVQKKYIEAIKKFDIVIGIGPAGTGKTYLAMAMAVSALKKNSVERIILARPAVEAGEKLGFLPGDLYEKVNPYLRPLYDALHDMMDFDKVGKMLQRGVIEVAPLGFMRGRTLNNSFVILDEAQNTTPEQMKMFLTRLGFNTKAIITGDITQIDLPKDINSGLVEAKMILKDISDIGFIYFSEKDVVRHPLVQEIIKAYEFYDNKK